MNEWRDENLEKGMLRKRDDCMDGLCGTDNISLDKLTAW